MRRPATRTGLAVLAAGLVALGTLTACSSGGGGGGDSASEVRIGYFPNLTHAPALVGMNKGFFTKALGKNVKVKGSVFNAGPEETEALFSGAIDIGYIGPSPTINAWQKSKGQAVKVIAGAASGGASLVVNKSIKKPADLRGKKIATPQLGNTQDVALRYWLKQKGYKTTQEGGGDVKILPQENSQSLTTFASGDIDGAWVPEPYATRMVLESKGHVLVNEKSLWPQGQFVTTNVIVRSEFLKEHPDLVKKFLQGHVDAVKYLNDNPADAKKVVNAALGKLSGKTLKPDVLDTSWKNLTFTEDPVATSLKLDATHAQNVGLLKPVDLNGIYDLDPLNSVLGAEGEKKVTEG